MAMGRKIVALVLGIVTAGVVIAIVEGMAHGRVEGDALFGTVAVGYGLGAFAGDLVALRLSGARWVAITATCILGLLGIINMFALPHPLWFAPVAAASLAAGLFAAIGTARRRGSASLP